MRLSVRYKRGVRYIRGETSPRDMKLYVITVERYNRGRYNRGNFTKTKKEVCRWTKMGTL